MAHPPQALSELLLRYVGQSENGIAVLDAQDIFLYHNRAFAQMFGFTAHAMEGQALDDMLRWMYRQRSGANIQWQTEEAWLDFVHGLHRSAPFRSFEVDLVGGRWLLMSVQVHEGGEAILICSDITRQKRTEQALRQAHADLERLAHTDELTGVPNRRHFLKQLEQECARAERYGHPACLAMLDLDNFKQVNDRYGHPVGDQVLKHFTSLLQGQLRMGDVIGRLGGEEFAILLPETPLDRALRVLERLRETLAKSIVAQVEPRFHYTFSAGVVELEFERTNNCNHWLTQADQALYQAKSSGRDRVVVHKNH